MTITARALRSWLAPALAMTLTLTLALAPAAAQDSQPAPKQAQAQDSQPAKKKSQGDSRSKGGDSQSKKKSSGDAKSKGDSKSKAESKSKGDSKTKGSKSGEPRPGKGVVPAPQPLSGDSFRGLAWGTPLSGVPGLSKREEQGGLAYYVRLGEDPEVLGVPMREIVYVFCRGRLSGALTRYDGEVNHLVLLARMREAYGAPLETPPNYKGDRSWRFDAGQTSMVMEYAPTPGTGAVGWMSQETLTPCRQ